MLFGTYHLQYLTGDTTFRGTVFNDTVSFNGSTFHNETYFSGTAFHNIAVFYGAKGDTFDFNFIKLGTQSLLDFRELQLKTMEMSTVQNMAAIIRFSNTQILERLVLKDTALGKSELNDFDLSMCKEIIITATSFLGTMFNNVSWGNITEGRFTASRDVYRQLKYVLEQQGNFIEANRFYSLEMKEYKKELSHQFLGFDTWQDKVVFFLHEKVSNFSQSWFLPLLWFFVIGILLTVYKNIQLQTIVPSFGSQLLTPTMLFGAWIIGKGASDLNERLRHYQFDFILPSLVLILTFLIVVPDALNEFARVVNPFGVFRESDSYTGIEFAWFLHKSVMAFVVYQFVVTLRMQTRRK